MHPGQSTRLAAELLPVGDSAAGHLNSLLLGELQIATWLVVPESDGASNDGDLHNTTPHLGQIPGLHGLIGHREIDGLPDQGPLS